MPVHKPVYRWKECTVKMQKDWNVCSEHTHNFRIWLECEGCKRDITLETGDRSCAATAELGSRGGVESKQVACNKCHVSVRMYFFCKPGGEDNDYDVSRSPVTFNRTRVSVIVTNIDGER